MERKSRWDDRRFQGPQGKIVRMSDCIGGAYLLDSLQRDRIRSKIV